MCVCEQNTYERFTLNKLAHLLVHRNGLWPAVEPHEALRNPSLHGASHNLAVLAELRRAHEVNLCRAKSKRLARFCVPTYILHIYI